MTVDRSIVDARWQRIEQEVTSAADIWKRLYAKHDFARVGHDVDLVTRSLLLRGMTSYRLDRNLTAARNDFRRAADLAMEFGRCLSAMRTHTPGAPQSYFDIASFQFPLHACLLAGDWKLADEVSKLSRAPEVLEKEDPLKATMTRMLASLILDDSAAFKQELQHYQSLKKPARWRHSQVYIDLYEAVIARNDAQYNDLSRMAEAAFLKRGSDREFANVRPEYGGGTNNALVLDLMAVGIAIVAAKQGLTLSLQSDVVPTALVSAILNG